MTDQQANIWVALFVGGLGILGLVYLVPFHVGRIGSSAALLPMLGFSALIILGAGLLAVNLRNPAAPPDEAEDRAGEGTESVPLLPIVAVLVLYAALMGQLGFLLASAVALFALLLLYRIRKPVALLLVTAGTIAVIHIGIERMLGTPLPSGEVLKAIPF